MDKTMEKRIALILLLMVSTFVSAKNDWKGKVVDEKGEPVAYANVAVLSPVDSSVVCGAVTEEDGSFYIVTDVKDGIMMVVMLGYQTQYLPPVDGVLVRLVEDAAMWEGAVVSAVMPKTKLTGEGLQTSVRGSVLENVGSAKDVLAKTPGLIQGQNGLEVIGKGAPLVYINGRKVTDSSELERLQSNEIQSVEVITNPGAQYDATVRSVVRIRTVRRQGDGFGFSLDASDAQSLRWRSGNDPSGALNMNYRTGGVDVFAGINYARNTSRQESYIEKMTFGKDYLLENKGDLLNTYFGQSLYGNAGVNWQLADKHFLGGKVEWGTQLQYDVHTVVNDNVWLDGNPFDKLTTTSDDTRGVGSYYNLGANLYYNGVIGEKLGLDVNLDYYGNDMPTTSVSKESSTMTHDALIRSVSQSDGRMYAAKAVLSYPLWKGQLQAGISAGVRYEHVRYIYEDALAPLNDIRRSYGNWFPTLSYAGVVGPVQLMFNYSARTQRPNYANLSSVIRYNSRYIWQSGNAQLQPDLSQNFSATAVWKFVTLIVNYARTDHAIVTWSSPYGDEGVVLVQPRNIDTPFRNMSAFVNLTPTVGCWNINYTLGIQPQWFTINAPDAREASGIRGTRFNGKPIGIAQLFNTFTVKNGWQFELGATVMTPGYTQNLYMRNWYCDVTAAVQKTLLPDGSLVVRLEGNDLAGAAHFDAESDFGSHTISQTNRMDTQLVKLSLRYNFNTARSKYKGTGAGSDTRSRM